jgi:hypothetical protein
VRLIPPAPQTLEANEEQCQKWLNVAISAKFNNLGMQNRLMLKAAKLQALSTSALIAWVLRPSPFRAPIPAMAAIIG